MADGLALMCETIGELWKCLGWKEAIEGKGLKVNLGKAKVMVSGNITRDDMSKSEVDSCEVCSSRVKVNSFCVYSVVSKSMADVQEWKGWLQVFKKF